MLCVIRTIITQELHMIINMVCFNNKQTMSNMLNQLSKWQKTGFVLSSWGFSVQHLTCFRTHHWIDHILAFSWQLIGIQFLLSVQCEWSESAGQLGPRPAQSHFVPTPRFRMFFNAWIIVIMLYITFETRLPGNEMNV